MNPRYSRCFGTTRQSGGFSDRNGSGWNELFPSEVDAEVQRLQTDSAEQNHVRGFGEDDRRDRGAISREDAREADLAMHDAPIGGLEGLHALGLDGSSERSARGIQLNS